MYTFVVSGAIGKGSREERRWACSCRCKIITMLWSTFVISYATSFVPYVGTQCRMSSTVPCKKSRLKGGQVLAWLSFRRLVMLFPRAAREQKMILRARPGFEPGTSRTLSENHTPRPTSHTAQQILISACDKNKKTWCGENMLCLKSLHVGDFWQIRLMHKISLGLVRDLNPGPLAP